MHGIEGEDGGRDYSFLGRRVKASKWEFSILLKLVQALKLKPFLQILVISLVYVQT